MNACRSAAVIDVLAQLADGALADAGQTHGLDQVVHAPGRDAADPRLLDHRHERLLGRLPWLQEGWEVAALPELRDPQLQAAKAGVERAVAIAVPIRRAITGALVPPGADQALHISLHQQLHDRLGHAAQEVAITGFGQELGKR
jgi:hypothetical protein